MSNHRPPKTLLRLLKWFCKPEYHSDIEGDLLELYKRRVEKQGKQKADWLLLKDILLLVRPGIIRSLKKNQRPNHYGMFLNYFKVTWRNLLRHKLYAFINVGGLAIGIACFVAIFLYVSHEFSYDKHFKYAERIYRIYTHERSGEKYLGSAFYATIPLPLAEAIRNEFPEIAHMTTMEEQAVLLGTESDHHMENGIWVDSQFFNVFSFRFLLGRPETALSHPESIILTKSLAFKLFGSNNPVGKTLTRQIRQDLKSFTVTGVIEDPPENTTFRFSFLAPIESHIYYRNSWDTSNSHTFMVLAEGADPGNVEAKIPDLLNKYQEVSLWTNYHQEEYLLQPFNEYHLETSVNNDIGLKGNPKQVNIFSIVAVLVLLLACINYMNLAIARSMNRAMEVGLRKVAGAVRWQLIGQFLGESVLLAFIALLLALGMLHFLLPVFSQLVERPLQLNLMENKLLAPGLLLLLLVVGVLSGSYPAFFMSGLRPILVLKGKIKSSTSQISFQRMLIIGQYAVSIIMIIASLVLYSQFRFVQQKEVGYNREHIITIRLHDFPSPQKYQVMKNEWLRNANIVQVTASTELPTKITSSTVINYEEGNTDDPLVMYRASVDNDFLDVFGIELISGRDLSHEAIGTSKDALLLNESACQSLGLKPEEAIGKHIKHRGTVIGVVKDFHMLSLHHSIEPLMLQMKENAWFEYISVKIRPEDIAGTLSLLEATVKQYSNFPFEYHFMNDEFDKLYKSDIRMGEILGFFTVLSVLIASMGLFGLAVFTAGQRIKEIGIRRVLGASVMNLVNLLSTDFLRLVLIGFLIATPIAWYLARWWLNTYTYKIGIAWWMFALPGLVTILLAFLTISAQSVKASTTNPVESLKHE